MASFVLRVDPYLPQTSVTLNGNSIASGSALSRYTQLSFAFHGEQIVNAMSDMAAEPFTVDAVMRAEDFEVLRYWSVQCPRCLSVRHVEWPIATSPIERMRQLSGLLIPVLQYRPNRFRIGVIVLNPRSLLAEEIRSTGITSRVADIQLTLLTPEMSRSHFDVLMAIAEGEDELSLLGNLLSGHEHAFLLLVSSESGLIGQRKGALCFSFKRQQLISTILNCLSVRFLPERIRECVDNSAFLMSPENAMQAMMLASCEPIVHVQPIDELELHTCSELTVSMFPRSGEVPPLRVESSVPQVISVCGLSLRAEAMGSSVITVYQVGSAMPLRRFEVLVIRRNRIVQIAVRPNLFCLITGRKQGFSVTVQPQDADNLHTLQLSSTDESVAQLREKREIVAIAPGECMLRVQAEQVIEEFPITVAPPIEGYDLPAEEIDMVKGETLYFEVLRRPRQAHLSQLQYSMDDPFVASYHEPHKMLIALNEGTTCLHVSNSDSSARCQVLIRVHAQQRGRLKKIGLLDREQRSRR